MNGNVCLLCVYAYIQCKRKTKVGGVRMPVHVCEYKYSLVYILFVRLNSHPTKKEENEPGSKARTRARTREFGKMHNHTA